MPLFCGECGAVLQEGIRFCGECGTAVDMSPAAPADSAPAARAAPMGTDRTHSFCGECGATTKSNQAYCRICGVPLQAGLVSPVGIRSSI